MKVWVISVSSFRYPVQFIADCAVVTLPGEVDFDNAETVRTTLLAVLNEGVAGVVADMTVTRYIAVAGIRAVVRAHKGAEEHGCWVRVAITHPGVRKAFALTGAESQVRIYASVHDALPSGPVAAAARTGWKVRLVPPQPRYPELVAAKSLGQAVAFAPQQRTEPREAQAAPRSPGGGPVPPVRDLAPEERTPGLIAQVRSACDHSRAARTEMRMACARLAVSCADAASLHEQLAQRIPVEAARLLAISETARDRARAYRRLAAINPV